MEDPYQRGKTLRLPLVIPVLPYLKDHHFEGKIIFPAVEILQRLAGSVQVCLPNANVACMRQASFNRFLHIERDAQVIEAFNEIDIHEHGLISSRMITIERIRGAMTRTKAHAAVKFTAVDERSAGLIMDMAPEPEDHQFVIPSQRLYSDLVPFGSSYQNVRGDVLLLKKGGGAQVYAAEHPAPSEPLGSPFPFDGALHVACAWGQRFHHIVAFPVGFEKRLIINPTVPGKTYFCRVVPVSVIGESLLFDIWIHDSAEGLCEEIRRVIMRDVSGGRVKPPDWILYSPFEKKGGGF